MKVVVLIFSTLLFTTLNSCRNDGEDTSDNSLEQSHGNYPANDSDQGGGENETSESEDGSMPDGNDMSTDSMGANIP